MNKYMKMLYRLIEDNMVFEKVDRTTNEYASNILRKVVDIAINDGRISFPPDFYLNDIGFIYDPEEQVMKPKNEITNDVLEALEAWKDPYMKEQFVVGSLPDSFIDKYK
jgi:hypothetical protein